MKPATLDFKAAAHRAIRNPELKIAMAALTSDLPVRLKDARSRIPEFDALRDQGKAIRDHVLAHLDFYLEEFERRATEQGTQVHWCETAADACQAIVDICKRAGARTVSKGKSMIAEEIGLNAVLEREGIVPVETDVGEHIVQIAHEPPSHIVAPALHVSVKRVSDLFLEHHQRYGKTERLEEPNALVGQVREILRHQYFAADVGITGANFLIAETGSTLIVTNEGNGDLTQMLPKVHIAVATIEKVLPTLDDAAGLLRLLAPSATGQELTVYTTLTTGPRRKGDVDGPEEFHVVLLDMNRSTLLGGAQQAVLRCIRCAACIDYCPVYQSVGGHAYGWVYPGPIGAALTPHLLGVAETVHLPRATTICGRCDEVCPVRIPLTEIMQRWREKSHETGVAPRTERFYTALWSFFARRGWLYRWLSLVGVALLAFLGRRRGRFSRMWLASGWTSGRDLPAPASRTFQHLYKKRKRQSR